MNPPDFRSLCAELVDIATAHCNPDDFAVGDCAAVLARARAALAQPVAEGPSEQEVSEWINSLPLWHGATRDELTGIVLRALARWGRPTPQPIAASERDRPTIDELQSMAKMFGLVVNDWTALRWLVVTCIAAYGDMPEPIPVSERLQALEFGYRAGYMRGHHDTVEGQYGDPDEVAADSAPEVLRELPLPAASADEEP